MLPHFLGNITLSATVVVSRCVDHRKLSGERPGQYWGGDPPKAGRAGQGVHRLAPGGIGCTRESHRRPPAGLAAHGKHTDGPPAGLVAHGNYTDGPRRDWLHTGITQTSPRRDWLHTGTTKRGTGGIGCTQGVHLYFETSPDHAVRSDQMAVSLKISFGKQKKEQFCVIRLLGCVGTCSITTLTTSQIQSCFNS